MPESALPTAESITHQHLLSVVNTIISRRPVDSQRPVRILDAGCGNGRFLHFLCRALPALHPGRLFEFFGFDVSDHGVQSGGFLHGTVSMLEKEIPGLDWSSRIRGIRVGEDWDFSAEKFDFIISNQVLEHVHDKSHFFRNVSRNLVDGGFSIHLAPLSHIVHEGHIYLPWAHRIRNYTGLRAYIRLMSRLGFGKFGTHKRDTGCTLDQYSERHADYMFFWTAYSSESETLHYARSNGLRGDFSYSLEFFTTKVRQLLRLQPRFTYHYRDASFFDTFAVKLLRYLSSVTLICEKKNSY